MADNTKASGSKAAQGSIKTPPDLPLLWGAVGFVVPWIVIIPGLHALMWVTPFLTTKEPNQTLVNLLFFSILSGLLLLIGMDFTRRLPQSQSRFQNVYIFSLAAVIYVLVTLNKI